MFEGFSPSLWILVLRTKLIKLFLPAGQFSFVDAGDEQLPRSSTTSRADELKILFIKFLICSLTYSLHKENEQITINR